MQKEWAGAVTSQRAQGTQSVKRVVRGDALGAAIAHMVQQNAVDEAFH